MIRNIKILSFICLPLTCFLSLSPATSMEQANLNIGDITPVKRTMNKEEAKVAIQHFLKAEVFKLENEIHEKDIVSDTTKRFGVRGDMHRFITLKDGTQWVGSKDGLQRFLGSMYLMKAINNHSLNNQDVKKFRAVDAKFMIKDQAKTIIVKVKKSEDTPLKNIFTINSDNFISFSRYIGDHIPTSNDLYHLGLDFSGKYSLTHTVGYADFGENANLRIEQEDDKVTVIDTEYSSFRNNDVVKPPSKNTESEIGGITFTFPIADFQ